MKSTWLHNRVLYQYVHTWGQQAELSSAYSLGIVSGGGIDKNKALERSGESKA
ncbi:MAG: hypothetical protein WKG06_38360 [Segetibacter sp.]